MSPWPAKKQNNLHHLAMHDWNTLIPFYVMGNFSKNLDLSLHLCCSKGSSCRVVDDTVAEQFLMALKRNISERGTPIGVILDNAPQFKFTKTTKAWRRVATDKDSYSL